MIRTARTPPLAALLLLVAGPAAADLVDPDAFQAMSEGRTLHFTLDGAPFGAEQFFPGRRSLWRFADGTCEPGRWEARDAQICFVYDSDPTPICWHFRDAGGAFAAHLVDAGAETGFRLDLARVADEPLACPGPDVGS
jgi:hypothetical protein